MSALSLITGGFLGDISSTETLYPLNAELINIIELVGIIYVD